MTVEEKQLADRIIQGDGRAFKRIVDECLDPVFNLAFRIIGNRDDAMDITGGRRMVLAANIKEPLKVR